MLRPMLALGVAAVLTRPASAQHGSDTVAALAVRLAALTAVTGLEQQAVDTLLGLLPASRRDRAGNAVMISGAGAPKRLAVCPIDEPGWVVGRIRPDGYLTLRRSPGPLDPLRDQQLEGQRVTVQTRRGAVPGVVAVRSIHLTRGRGPRGDAPFTADSAVVDLGAATAAEAAALGIALLAPVTLAKRPHRYGPDLLAAPSVGRRAACAALLAAAGVRPAGTVVIAFAVEQRLSQRGLATLAATLGPFQETMVVDGGPDSSAGGEWWPGLGRVSVRALPVRYAGSAVETIALGDAERLSAEIGEWIQGGGGR